MCGPGLAYIGPEAQALTTLVTTLEESEESVYFLVVRNVFNEGHEGIPHGHVMGVGFANEAHRRLRVNGVV